MPADSLFDQALKAEGVTGKLADLARSIYTQESGGGKNTKTSNRGAVGGMQIRPSTFRGVADEGWSIDNPLDNARGGIRYLKQMATKAGGDPALTAAGYYGGPGAIDKARKGIAVSDPKNPNAPNTLQYGAQVAARAGLGGAAPTAVAQAPTPAPVAPAAAYVAPSLLASVPSVTPAMSPEVVPPVQVAERAVPVTPVASPAGPDPWQEFLRTAQAEPRPVTPEDFNYLYGQAPVAQAPTQVAAAPVPQSVTPNFQAFSSWIGHRA